MISTIAPANGVIECRVLTKGYHTCTPYSTKYLYAKEIEYDIDRKKLISVKSLPIQEKKNLLKVISAEENLIPSTLSKEPLRFKGSKSSIFEQPLDIIDEVQVEREKLPSQRRALMSQEVFETYMSELDRHAKELHVKEEKKRGIYVVVEGDVLSRIAKKFNMKTADLVELNNLKKDAVLRIGQTLILPYTQEMVDAISSARYRVKKGDTLISIAKKFDLQPEDLISFNQFTNQSILKIGTVLDLPLPHRLKELASEGKYSSYGTKSLRVIATAYTSHPEETDDTPFLAAWNNRLVPGMKVIAVSRDLLSVYGMKNGTKVRISGLPGIYHVRDKMNKRFKKRIDIYMGMDRQKALRWGRRSVQIFWD